MDISTSSHHFMGSKETLHLIEDLEQRLRGHIDRLEHLELCVSEPLIHDVGSIGFSYMERSSTDLKMDLAGHLGFLCELNDRLRSLETGTTFLAQASTKPRMWGRRRAPRPHSTRPHVCDNTQSELGWSPRWKRRNSDAASEMSCAW